MPINDGGRAFPVMHSIDGNWNKEPFPEHMGMTLRAYIATHAMTGLLQNSQYPASEVAKAAVSFADALIAELETKKEE